MEKKSLKIMGISIWRILAYFIIYSFFGYVIETLFGIATKGVWESRQSFLYGPFCAIYGLGACIMIMFLYRYGKKYNALFLGGFIIGSVIEYLVSLIGEMILGVKWWDYSDMPNRQVIQYRYFPHWNSIFSVCNHTLHHLSLH